MDENITVDYRNSGGIPADIRIDIQKNSVSLIRCFAVLTMLF